MDVRGDTDVQIVRYTWVQGRKTNRTIRITVAQQLYQVKWMIEGNRERAVFDLFSKL